MINLDKNNARVHSKESQNAVHQSLKQLGAGRSIVIDADNTLIGGEATMTEAQNLGIKVKIIDSDGSELIAVRRTDLKYDDPKRKALALADNRCNDLSQFDTTKVVGAFMECDDFILATGFTTETIKEYQTFDCVMSDLVENNFTNSIKGISDVFSITFSFDKIQDKEVGDFLNLAQFNKTVLAELITEYCKNYFNSGANNA